ncbi:lactonase family protein [Polaribacter sp. R77954]|uniref:lactonase family protein n=1 Tax=Polaribacter sp. R77954 TaxID=3093870 RepID=UPI0037C9F409
MKKLVLVSILTLLISCKASKMKEEKSTTFYVGTYTNGESEGIYQYQINPQGVLSKIGLVAKTNNPSFLARTKDHKTLIAVEETNKNGTGFVKSYAIHKDALVFKSTSKSGGGHPCFVTISDNKVLVANYTGGTIGYLQLDNQNGLTNLLAIQQHTGKGTTTRQQAPHAHSTWFHPCKKEVIAADLGTNELWFSTINKNENSFVFTQQKTLQMAEGAGPRHLTFHPNHQWIYVLNELNNTVSLVKEKNNTYFVDSSISMLPKGYSKYTKAADIHISKDGRFLYASNRGHNSIVIYKVNPENGNLELVGFESVKGISPRNFSLSLDDKFLVVANQDSNNIVSFQRNAKTGKLIFVSEIATPNPVCILF